MAAGVNAVAVGGIELRSHSLILLHLAAVARIVKHHYVAWVHLFDQILVKGLKNALAGGLLVGEGMYVVGVKAKAVDEQLLLQLYVGTGPVEPFAGRVGVDAHQ